MPIIALCSIRYPLYHSVPHIIQFHTIPRISFCTIQYSVYHSVPYIIPCHTIPRILFCSIQYPEYRSVPYNTQYIILSHISFLAIQYPEYCSVPYNSQNIVLFHTIPIMSFCTNADKRKAGAKREIPYLPLCRCTSANKRKLVNNLPSDNLQESQASYFPSHFWSSYIMAKSWSKQL